MIKGYFIHIAVSALLLTAACQNPAQTVKAAPEIEPQNTAHAEQPWDIWTEHQPGWAAPHEPFNIIANVYYVGSKELSSFLITSDAGHIVLDGGLPQNASRIADNIKALGFDITDVKILLSSHAHFDHSGGLAELKRLSGAKMMASAADTPWLENGFYPGSTDPRYSAPPVTVDAIIKDQQDVTLGPITLKAKLTPGHSPGCTSWTMTAAQSGEQYSALFFCGATVAGNKLVDPPQHSGIVADYRKTFDITKDWTPDIFLSNHPSFFAMDAKYTALKNGDPLAFIDRQGFPKMMHRLETKFEEALAVQTAEAEAKIKASNP